MVVVDVVVVVVVDVVVVVVVVVGRVIGTRPDFLLLLSCESADIIQGGNFTGKGNGLH